MTTRNLTFENEIKNFIAEFSFDQLNTTEKGRLLIALERLCQVAGESCFMDTVKKVLKADDPTKVCSCSGRYELANAMIHAYKYYQGDSEQADQALALELKDKVTGYAKDYESESGITGQNDTQNADQQNNQKTALCDTYATQVFYMNYETMFGGKEHYNDIIAHFNCMQESVYNKDVSAKEAAMYLCALIDTMEVMEQPLYEIYHRLMTIFKGVLKDVLTSGCMEKADDATALYFAYAVLKACRMKAIQTERYEMVAEEILSRVLGLNADKSIDQCLQQGAELVTAGIMAYGEAIRNREYQDYGRNKGGILWS